jgi:Bax protein
MRSISLLQAILCLLLCIIAGCSSNPLRPEYVVVESPDDIVPLRELDQVPLLLYNNQYDFSQLEPDEKKRAFIDLMLPSILAVKYNYDNKFKIADRILRMLHEDGFVDHEDSIFMNENVQTYGAANWWDLRRRLKTHPVSVVLAQAAVESGWGSSRFFREANNVFGIWSFDQSESRIRSQSARDGISVFLRSYPNVAASIQDYFDVLSRGKAYRKFRVARTRNTQPLELIEYLHNYSELRGGYVRKLRNVITQNSLAQYDSSTLSERYTRDRQKLYF